MIKGTNFEDAPEARFKTDTFIRVMGRGPLDWVILIQGVETESN